MEARRLAIYQAERAVIEAKEKLTYARNQLDHTAVLVRKGHLTPAARDALGAAWEKSQLEFQNACAVRDRLVGEQFSPELAEALIERDAAESRMKMAQSSHELALARWTQKTQSLRAIAGDATPPGQTPAWEPPPGTVYGASEAQNSGSPLRTAVRPTPAARDWPSHSRNPEPAGIVGTLRNTNEITPHVNTR
jgi:hypothetical protein